MVERTDASGARSVTSEGGSGETFKRLSVSSFKKKARRTSETSFEDQMAAALLECGLASWHMAMREEGWPDRYVHGGIWMELKSLEALGKDTGLSPGQVRKLKELTRAGERTFYCAKFERSVILKPWPVIRDAKDLKDIERYAYRNRGDLVHAIRHELF